MSHDVFISYSSKDKPAADAACAVLEARGIRCWIAPRDILPGADWGESIINAINACKLMVLIFSQHANESQQVKREVERIVHRGFPIIPVRIEDVLPAQALEYFLSSPHWLDAFTPPLEQHLERLAATVQQILNHPGDKPTPRPRSVGKSWRRYIQPVGLTAAVIVGLSLLAMIAFRDRDDRTPIVGPVKSHQPGKEQPPSTAEPVVTNPQDDKKPEKPTVPARPTLVGRWQAEMTDASGKTFRCQMDMTGDDNDPLGSMSLAFSDECPFPFCGANLSGSFPQSDMFAPRMFIKGKDTGTFYMLIGSNGQTGTYRLDKDTLILTFELRAEIRWNRIKAEGPLPNGADAVIPPESAWPAKDVPNLAKHALEYIQSHWQKDAQLWQVELERRDLGGLAAPGTRFTFEFTSRVAGKMLRFLPRSEPTMILYGDTNWSSRALPATFLDLPDAIASKGLLPEQVSEASVQYEPPSSKPPAGFYWRLKTDSRTSYNVLATKP